MSVVIYNIVFLPLLRLAFFLLWPFNSKVRKGMRGRRFTLAQLRTFLDGRPDEPRLWVHASSLGEFEQAKPIIEEMKARIPGLVVIASFFSPSGYENTRRYTAIDAGLYIPFDTPARAREFLSLLRPTAAMFIRYDVWPNHVSACSELGIPVLLANATLRCNSARLWPGVRGFHRRLFENMSAILTVSDSDAECFRRFGTTHPDIMAIGDTRYDRVLGNAGASRQRALLPAALTEGRKVVVAGSVWQEDEDVFLPVMFKLLAHDPDTLFILVPHEPTIEHLESLEYRIGPQHQTLRFSFVSSWKGERVLLVDSIGILLPLYASADIAFVGGSFRSNVHNTLEPAAYGIPVLYGPKIDNSQEAVELVDAGGSSVVHNRRQLYRVLRQLLTDDALRGTTGECAGSFVASRAGSTAHILEHLLPHFE